MLLEVISWHMRRIIPPTKTRPWLRTILCPASLWRVGEGVWLMLGTPPNMLMLMSTRFTMSEINSGLHKPSINKGLVKSNSWLSLLSQLSRISFRLFGLHPTGLLCPWDSPGKNTGVGCRFLLQGIFLSQGSNLHLLHWQEDSLPLSHLGYFFNLKRADDL